MILSDIYSTDGVLHFRAEGFSVHAHRNRKHRPHGPSAYAKSIRKYRIGATSHTPFFFDEIMACVWHHKHLRKARIHNNNPEEVWAPLVDLDSGDGMSIVQAEDIQNDTEYACPVTIGTPGVTLTLDFDTGSSDFWVWSSEFRADRAQLEGHQIYNPDKSRTAERLPGATWKISYGDGSSASGDVILDTVMIGDIKIKRQAVELSQHLSDEFLKGGSDGLLGLAFPKLNTVEPYQQKTPMQNMVEQGLVKEPIFSVKLDKHDSRGYYTFGYINEHIHASQLYWREVITDNGLWEVASPYVKIGSKIYDRGHSNTAIIDTGTTLILMDDETIKHLYSQIPGAKLDRSIGGYVFPTDAHIPQLAFCVGRWLFTVPSEDLAFSDTGNGMSYGAIQSRGQNKQDILGDVFLKHVYVVFDQGTNPRVGVAQR
ncbi:aspartic peptidase domain-containing protein [Rhizoctonia solani]|nr:aspartic peptidase domain-containing protein [Rhizoctonia solani]